MKTLIYNGNIITMNEKKCEAILIDENKVIDMGNYDKFKDMKCIKYNLKGHTLIPAFIDSHSHLSSYANSMLQVNLENAIGINDIKKIIKKYIDENITSDNQWIIANSYSDNNLKGGEKLNREILDSITMSIPLVVQNKNGHNGIFNKKAIEILNINSIDGILEEKEYMKYIEKVPMPDFKTLIASYKKAQYRYLKYGITHIQEGIIVKPMIPIYQYLIENDILFLDTVVYPNIDCFDEFKTMYPEAIGKYYHHMKIGGIKIILDGSPQSKTAWMKTPYKNTNSYGYGVMTDDEVYQAINKAISENVQIIAHCNGDMAIEQYLNNLEKFDIHEIKKIKPVIIHSQLLNINQLDRVKKLGIIPSFFVSHVYYFGDIHIQNFGFDRASKISPTNSTLNKNILFTFHQDTPVVEPDIIKTLWISTNRITKNNVLLGSEEKINIYEALKAQTINAAYQYGEEDLKGNIAINTYANFVVLDKNIIDIDSKEIKNIQILDVIYNGKSIKDLKINN